MKRKFFTAFLLAGALAFTACQEDSTMNELADDIELNQTQDPGNDGDDDKDGPGGNAGNQ